MSNLPSSLYGTMRDWLYDSLYGLARTLVKYPLLSNLIDSINGYSGTLTRSTTKIFIHDDLTVDTAAIDTAAFTGSGVLLEPEATNLLLYSQDLSNAAWTKTTMTVNSNYINAPDGTLTADRVVATSTSSNIRQTVTITSGQKRYTSFFMKAGTSAYIFVDIGFGGNAARTWINCSTGAIGTTLNLGSGWTLAEARSTAVSDGYFFIEIDVNTTGTSLIVLVGLCNVDGSTGTTTNKTAYLWQFDNKENASSPIPTTSTALTRTVDELTVPTTGMPTNNFSYYIEFTPTAEQASSVTTILRDDYGVSDYTYLIYNHGITSFSFVMGNGDQNRSGNIGVYPLVIGTKYKIMLSVTPTATTLNVNGTTVMTGGNTNITRDSAIKLGTNGTSGINGKLASFKVLNSGDLTLDQAEAL